MSARQYFARSPRYVFNNDDNSLVRFAPMRSKGVARSAVVQDLSDSGLSFTLALSEPIDLVPDEGTALKIQFPIPGRSSIACFATVTRVEQRHEYIPEYGDRGYHLIALQFRHLPSLHLRAIQRGLEGKVAAEHSFDHALNLTELRRVHALAFLGMSFALFASCFALTLSAQSWAQTLAHYLMK